ncbi:DnaJ domain-containing protein [Xylariaceae sp. FL0594]|nr:DnaJ domain-containing protein [Xylariaceae sp. FL0594]
MPESPGERQSPDLYKALEVPTDADTATIEKAFRTLSLQHHPDKANARTAPKGRQETEKEKTAREKKNHDRFILLAKARDTLCDPAKREAYDWERDQQRYERHHTTRRRTSSTREPRSARPRRSSASTSSSSSARTRRRSDATHDCHCKCGDDDDHDDEYTWSPPGPIPPFMPPPPPHPFLFRVPGPSPSPSWSQFETVDPAYARGRIHAIMHDLRRAQADIRAKWPPRSTFDSVRLYKTLSRFVVLASMFVEKTREMIDRHTSLLSFRDEFFRMTFPRP